MMVNARPCALVTNRAVDVDLSRGVESGHTVILTCRCTKLLFFRICYGWMSESNGCAMELNPMRIGRDASCDSLDTRTHFPKCLNPFGEHEDVMSSTVVLSNSGHDHIRNSFVLEKKSRFPYKVAPCASAILVSLLPKACISGGLRSVLSICEIA